MALHPKIEALLCASPQSLDVRGWFEQLPNVEFVNCRTFQFLHLFRDSELSQHLKRFSPDVIFVPVERSFRFRKVPVVNMIQNMEPLVSDVDANPFSERFRQCVQYIYGRRAMKKANGIIAISRFVSDFLITDWIIPSQKINLVYHGIDVEKNEDGYKPDIIPDNWNDNFIFTAGSIRPARGLEDLFHAIKYLSLQGEKSFRLVIAGESGHIMAGYQKRLKDWAQENNLSDRICWTGNLNEKEMAWCYQNASAFVMTSRVESFGMIGGEAMAHGCICISADNPCLPELFENVAVYYLPKDEKTLADTIKTVLAWDDNQRKVMSEKATKRAAEFSWDVCAEKTVMALDKAIKNCKLNGRNIQK